MGKEGDEKERRRQGRNDREETKWRELGVSVRRKRNEEEKRV